jgi:hypothetical protein
MNHLRIDLRVELAKHVADLRCYGCDESGFPVSLMG